VSRDLGIDIIIFFLLVRLSNSDSLLTVCNMTRAQFSMSGSGRRELDAGSEKPCDTSTLHGETRDRGQNILL